MESLRGCKRLFGMGRCPVLSLAFVPGIRHGLRSRLRLNSWTGALSLVVPGVCHWPLSVGLGHGCSRFLGLEGCPLLPLAVVIGLLSLGLVYYCGRFLGLAHCPMLSMAFVLGICRWVYVTTAADFLDWSVVLCCPWRLSLAIVGGRRSRMRPNSWTGALSPVVLGFRP